MRDLSEAIVFVTGGSRGIGRSLSILLAEAGATVYTCGRDRPDLEETRRQARQMVSHKHIVVNDQVVNIPSYSLSPGDVVEVRPKSKNLQMVEENLEHSPTKRYKWLEVDKDNKKGKFLNEPEMEQIPENINVQLIVELYSK